MALFALLPLAIAFCFIAAKWQYGRHVERAQIEAQLSASESLAPRELLATIQPQQELAADLRFVPVSVIGEYLPDRTIYVRSRTLDAVPGFWAVTPLRAGDGTTVVVMRGWVAADGPATEVPDVPDPPTGVVKVTGVLQPSEPSRGSGSLAAGLVTTLSTQQLCPEPECLRPYLQATASVPADAVEPLPVTGPGVGPHLAYAGQWLLFAAMLPAGLVLLLRREVRDAGDESIEPGIAGRNRG